MNKPNLTNYKEAYKSFKWQAVEKELLFFDKSRKKINIAHNIDRNAMNEKTRNNLALFFQDEKGKIKQFTYFQLMQETNKLGNLLRKKGIKKGDRVFLFLPKIPELYFSFIAALKLGAIAVPIFEAFGSQGIEERLWKGRANIVITNKELKKRIKSRIKSKLRLKIIDISSVSYRKELKSSSDKFNVAKTGRKDTAFMLFTSSTAGTPVVGIMLPHQTILQQYITGKWVLDLKREDRYFCTAHPGWVTGSVYGIIAPLVIGSSIFILDGRFDAKVVQNFISKNKISVVYTAPTALRMLQQDLEKKKWKNIRHLCSVGEFLNPETFSFYKKRLGIEIHDTYWQTETGAIVIANFRCMKKKPGSMGLPVPGVEVKIYKGAIALNKNFPSLMQGIYNNQKMYKSYFKGELFLTKDLATQDKQGYIFFKARQDDIIKTSGERVSPIEIESVLMQHNKIREAAIISKPDKIRGSIIVAFIVFKDKKENKERKEKLNEKQIEEIQKFVKNKLAGHVYPREIYSVAELPKTRSGKIMRRLLKAILLKEKLENISNLVSPECVERIRRALK